MSTTLTQPTVRLSNAAAFAYELRDLCRKYDLALSFDVEQGFRFIEAPEQYMELVTRDLILNAKRDIMVACQA
jgi:hypothetical protein